MSQFRIRSEFADGAAVTLVLLVMLVVYGVEVWRTVDHTVPPPGMVTHPASGSKDSALRTLAGDLLDAEPAIRALWPDGWSFAPSLIYFDDPRSPVAVLITEAPPTSGFTAVASRGAGRPRAYMYRGALPGLNGTLNLRYPVGGQTVIAIPWKESAAVTASLLIHEAFHVMQRERFEAREASPVLTDALTASPRFRALTEIERRILVAALRARSRDEVAELGRQLLAVRRERYRHTDGPTTQRADRIHERIEGSAEWIGREGARLALRASRDSAERALIDEWLRPPLDHPSVPMPDRLVRTRAYGTGPALAIVLERLGVAWQRPLQRGVAFDEQLAAALGPHPPRIPLDSILVTYGYDGALAAARSVVAPLGANAALDSFASSVHKRVIVELFSAPMLNVKADAMLRPKEKLLLFMPARRFTFLEGDTRLTVQDRPVSVDDAPSPMRITVLVDRLPLRLTGGATLRADPEGAIGPVSLTAAGFELVANRASLRHVTADSIVVRIPHR